VPELLETGPDFRAHLPIVNRQKLVSAQLVLFGLAMVYTAVKTPMHMSTRPDSGPAAGRRALPPHPRTTRASDPPRLKGVRTRGTRPDRRRQILGLDLVAGPRTLH